MQDAARNFESSVKLKAAEAGAELLREEILETKQALSWREEELGVKRKANAESEVRHRYLQYMEIVLESIGYFSEKCCILIARRNKSVPYPIPPMYL